MMWQVWVARNIALWERKKEREGEGVRERERKT
jgi:hypothetical protein